MGKEAPFPVGIATELSCGRQETSGWRDQGVVAHTSVRAAQPRRRVPSLVAAATRPYALSWSEGARHAASRAGCRR